MERGGGWWSMFLVKLSSPPFERTARQVSGDRSSGYDIFWDEEELDPKRLPRKGMVGMDLRVWRC